MVVYISTGGFSDLNCVESAKFLTDFGFGYVEFSGGQYSLDCIGELKKITNIKKLHFHNYFPVPQDPFVLNLASLDEIIAQRSLRHVLHSIELAHAFGCESYSVHAGFLVDPDIAMLGKRFSNRSAYPRQDAIECFIEKIGVCSDFCESLGIKLYIENNVVTKNNFDVFGQNPFLMADPVESINILSHFSENVCLMLDVGHAKVSSETLGFPLESFFDRCSDRISAYHLSDNDGVHDSNSVFDRNSWFWSYLDPTISHVTIEVYSKSLSVLNDQYLLAQDFFGN